MVLPPRAPPPPPPPRTITADLGLDSAAIELEQSLGRVASLFAGPTFNLGSASENFMKTNLYGAGAIGGARVFFGQNAPKGSWMSASGSWFRAWGRFDDGQRVTGAGRSFALLFGYTWIWESAFVLSIGGGAQYLDFNVDLPSITFGLHGIVPAFRGAIGYAF